VKALRDSDEKDSLVLFKVEFLIQRKNSVEATQELKWDDLKEKALEYVQFVEQDPQARRHISWSQWNQNPEESKTDVLIQNTTGEKFEILSKNIQEIFFNSGYNLKEPQPYEQSKVEAIITGNSWFDFSPYRTKYDEWCQQNPQSS